jgi:hypothetical protein
MGIAAEKNSSAQSNCFIDICFTRIQLNAKTDDEITCHRRRNRGKRLDAAPAT